MSEFPTTIEIGVDALGEDFVNQIHNAYGGLWAVHAMSNIAEYIRANLDVKVIG